MTNINYQSLYEKLEDNNLPELKKVLKSKENILKFLKFQSTEDNNNTPLHIAFAAVNIDLIKFLIKDLSSSELQEVINIQNKGGINPAGKILDIEEGSAESLEKIVGAFTSEEMKKNVLISYGVYNETILHQLVKYYDSELFTKLLDIAKSNKLLSDILYAQDEVNDNPLHAAIINNTPDNNTQEFITKILAIAKENGIIFDILKSQGENDNTVIHLGFASEDAVINGLVVDSLTKLKNEEIAEIIEIQNKGGIKVISNLFEGDKLEIIFQNIADKTILLNSIISNVLNDEELGFVEDDNKSTVKAKITAIYNLIKDQAELKQKLVKIINLEATEYNVTDFFNNEIIGERLNEIVKAQKEAENSLKTAVTERINEIVKAQKEAIDSAKNEDEVATVYATAEDKLAKLKDVFAKLDETVKTGAESSLKTAVIEKINEIVKAQKEAIDSAKNEDEVATVYATAEDKLAKLKDVFAKLDETVKTGAVSSLKTAVTEKINEIVKAQKEAIASAKNEDEVATVYATAEDKLAKLKDVFAKLDETVKTGAESSLKTAVIEKINEIVKAQKEAIDSAKNEDEVATVYATAEDKLAKLKDVFAKLDETVKTGAESSLKTAVTEKINEIVKAQKEAIASAKNEDEVATVYATAEDKLAKLKDVFAKLDETVKTGAESSLKTAVTEKINEIVKAQKEAIASAKNEDEVATVYATAEDKLAKLKDVFAKLDETVKTGAESSLKTAVIEKINEIVKAQKEAIDSAKNEDEVATVYATAEDKLAKLKDVFAKLDETVKTGAESSLKTAVTEKINEIVKAQKEAIASAKNEDEVATVYATAEDKLAKLKDVFAKLDETVKTGAESSLKTAVIEKINEIVKAQKEAIDSAKNEDEVATVYATAEDKLAKLKDVFAKLDETVKTGAESSLKTAVTEKINEIVKAQKEAIASAKNEDEVATVYATAEDKLAKLKDVFAKLDETVKTGAESSLKTAVTEKITAFVDSACKKEKDELVEAQNCLDTTSNLQKTDIFKNVIEGNVKEKIDTNKISAQEQLEKTNISLDDIKKGLSNTFYYAKDLIVNKDIARYESASDSDKKSWASETRKIMTKLKSGIDGKTPGIDKIDGYNKIYVQDALGRCKDTKTFIKNIVEKDYKGKVESNADVSKKAACDKFNLNESECTDPKIMESIKTNVCDNNSYTEEGTNAYKLFCDASTSDIDGLSFDNKLVTELDYA